MESQAPEKNSKINSLGRIVYRSMSDIDIPAMVELGAAMHQESAFCDLDYDRDKCFSLGVTYVLNPEVNFGYCAYEGDDLVGMFMGYVSRYYFGNDLLANDILWYVRKDKRGSMIGIRLLNAFRDWAKERGAREVCIGVSTALDLDRTHKLLSRMGLVHVGGTFKEAIGNVET